MVVAVKIFPLFTTTSRGTTTLIPPTMDTVVSLTHRTTHRRTFMRTIVDETSRSDPPKQIEATVSRRSFLKSATAAAVFGAASPHALMAETRETAARQIEEALKRLQTYRIDLMQFHEIIRLEDPDRIFAPGGAIEAMLEAKRSGKIRYIGFTGHKDPFVHLRMLEIAAANKFRFDAVQMPLNVMDAHFRSFEHQVLPRLVADEIGVLGMKSMGDPLILESKTVTPLECLHYALNLPISTVITGIDSLKILDQALEA